ncbi:MAG: 4Fe-4S dicluster domain-containing protein [Acidobacteria bacterium]|nr:4Fe-4S dicluster domain-containing protein [Acidobacteriota bacterium]
MPEHPHKATSLMLFPHIKSACEAIPFLKQSGVAAAELMDRASLRSVEHKPGMPDYLKTLKPEAAALLVEARAPEEKELREQVEQVRRAIAHLPTVHPIGFTTEAAEYTQLWNIRKGLLTSAGAVRQAGTTVILEDVAVPIHRLAQATLEFQGLLAAHGYDQAIIFGHALEGNLHFVFPQSFHSASEVERFGRFTDDLCRVVVGTYDGSLKAEHGTGRTMAPYVEMEWGEEAYGLMKEIKAAFDPDNLLNPGVILNDDAQIHLKHLKPLPIADPLVDKCIECGFCESGCPSRHLTLTPRQRIAVWREIACLSAGPKTRREAELRKAYSYQGEQTCATDGLCAMACPVDIDTGKLIKQLRSLQRSALSGRVASWAARHMGATTAAMRLGLNALDGAHRLLGTAAMGRLAAIARRAFFNSLPQWNSALPRGADRIRRRAPAPDHPRQVVYFPSCVSRSLGPSRGGSVRDSQIQRTEALLRKAGCEVIYPDGIDGLCCGMAYTSKGYAGQGDEKLRQLEGALMEASKGGRHPVLFDTSPCLFRWREAATPQSGLQVFDPVEFIEDHLMRRLSFHVLPVTVALHITCSARKLGLADRTRRIAALCAETVVVPDQVGCCGFAGDRGFTVPELNASALHELKSLLPAECRSGYSTSRTCEIGMSLHGGIPYQSIVYLVDQATEPRNSESRS